MWKYSDSNAYRVVLIEAGHIGQNIMLAATAQAFRPARRPHWPTARSMNCFGLTRLTHAPLYALTCRFQSRLR